MTGYLRTRAATRLAGGIGALALTAALSACASSTTAASGVGTVSLGGSGSAAASPSAPAVSSPSPAAGASSAAPIPQPSAPAAHPSIGTPPSGVVGTVQAPKELLGAVPAGAKLTPFDTAVSSHDGRTLFVSLESMGGACGQYSVVLQQSNSAVHVGLVHLSSGTRMCPQYVGRLNLAVQLAAPLAGRTVVDLATGQSLNVG